MSANFPVNLFTSNKSSQLTRDGCLSLLPLAAAALVLRNRAGSCFINFQVKFYEQQKGARLNDELAYPAWTCPGRMEIKLNNLCFPHRIEETNKKKNIWLKMRFESFGTPDAFQAKLEKCFNSWRTETTWIAPPAVIKHPQISLGGLNFFSHLLAFCGRIKCLTWLWHSHFSVSLVISGVSSWCKWCALHLHCCDCFKRKANKPKTVLIVWRRVNQNTIDWRGEL